MFIPEQKNLSSKQLYLTAVDRDRTGRKRCLKIDFNIVAFFHLAQKVLSTEIGDMKRDYAGFTARSSENELFYETVAFKSFANS